jgi:hypothetical protein
MFSSAVHELASTPTTGRRLGEARLTFNFSIGRTETVKLFKIVLERGDLDGRNRMDMNDFPSLAYMIFRLGRRNIVMIMDGWIGSWESGNKLCSCAESKCDRLRSLLETHAQSGPSR